MNNRSVIIITGEEMFSLSNQIFKIDVHPKCDHSYMLSEFIEEHEIDYPYIDYISSHDIVKMAILSNIVMFKSRNFNLISLPDKITDFQVEQLQENNLTVVKPKEILCLMSMTKEKDKLIFEEYNSSIAPKLYVSLIDKKHKKWQEEQTHKTKKKDYPENV